MTDRFWQNWDVGDTAGLIDSYWLSSPHEQSLRKIFANDLYNVFGKKASILEIGSGSGLVYQEMLNKHIITIKSYIGGDVSQKMLDIARHRYPKTNFIELDILNLPFTEKSQSNVICVQVLQHLPHYDNALRELMRITKERLYIVSWFNLSSEDDISFTSTPFPGTFYNNKYSLSRFFNFVYKTVGDKIETLSVRNLDNYTFSIYLKFKKEIP